MNQGRPKPPLIFTATLVFILTNAAIWLVFAGITAFGAHPSFAENNPLRWIMTAISAAIGIWMIFLTGFLRKRSRLIYNFTLITLIGLLLVIFLDQVGPIDLAVLFAALMALVLLLLSRRWYFSQPAGGQ